MWFSSHLALAAVALRLTGQVHGLGYVEKAACGRVAATYKYNDANTTGNANLCKSKAFIGTAALCIQAHTQNTQKWWEIFDAAYCARYKLPLPDFAAVIENATSHIGDAPKSTANKTALPFQVPEATYEAQRKQLDAAGSNLYWSTTYAWLMVVMGAIVIFLIAILKKLEGVSFPQRWRGANKAVVLCKKHLVLPTLYGSTETRNKHLFGIPLATPWRLQSIIVILFIAINVVMLFASVNVYDGNVRYKTRLAQWSKYIADRSGILSLGQLPFLIIFAGRNHIFMWATGWSFHTFNRFHKIIACMLTAHAIVHAGLYTYIEALKEPLHEFWAEDYMPWGIAGLAAWIMLTTGSIAVLRNYWYDAWLTSHIILAAVSILGTWKHVRMSHNGNGTQIWMPWIYAAVALWIFDRILRIIRVIAFNYSTVLNGDAHATAVLLNEDVVKMDVPVSPLWKFYPGQYLFLYMPTYSYQQNHPFTVIDVNRSGRLPTATIIFKARKGMTKKIHEACLQHSSATGTPLQLRALVEGPYGTQPRLNHFDSVILAAGGIGITAIVPFLMYLVASPIVRPSRSIAVHWAVRNAEQAIWFADEFSRALGTQAQRKNLIVKIVIHVTNGLTSSSSSMTDEKKTMTVTTVPVDLPEDVEVRRGRPALTSVVTAEVQETMDGTNVAVVSCGPSSFGDACRASVIANLGASSRRISHIEENFGW